MLEITLDKFIGSGSIFSRIQTLSPYPFFAQMPPLDMDIHLKMFYGERIVYPKIVEYQLDDLARLINSVHKDKWENLIKFSGVDISKGSTRTVDETKKDSIINTGANTRTHNVSAFNTDNLIADNSDIDSSTSTVNNDGTRLLTESNSSLQTVYNNLLLSQKLNIIEVVVKDTASYLTLDIY